MKRILSTLLFIGLLLGLGAAAFLAFPGGESEVVESEPLVDAGAAPAAQAQAPTADSWNELAIPLSTTTITKAQSLADEIPGSVQLLSWNSGVQNFEFYFPGFGFGTNFDVELGGAYFVQVNSGASNTFTVVGDVPPQTGQPGAVQFSLVGSSPCQWNHVSIPLDQGAVITDAQSLGDDVGDVDQILSWDPGVQNFQFYFPDFGFGTNFAVNTGYPYFICSRASKNWP